MKPWCYSLVFALAAAGCFYPPVQKPLPDDSAQVTLAIPFDLAWEAIHKVLADDGFRVIAEDPNNGIIETQAVGGFSLSDADCGDVRGIALKYRAVPDPGSSAVYNFEVEPKGDEATSVGVQAVFTSQLQIPLRLMSSENCVSTGVQEARLLKQIKLQSHQEHRPQYKPPTG